MNAFPLAVGHLLPYLEYGSHSLTWAVHDNSLPSYHGLFVLQNGDFLRILDERMNPVWEGAIELDYDQGWQPFPDDPMFGCQWIGNQRVNWVQKNVSPETWMGWFQGRYRAVLTRNPDQVLSTSVSPLVQAVVNLPPERWLWRAPQRFFDGLPEVVALERSRIVNDLQPAVAWIAHALGWKSAQISQSLDVPSALAEQWSAPPNLPWERLHAENPEWETRGAHLLAFYAHLHWTLGERVNRPETWDSTVRAAVAAASESFAALQEAVASLAPDPDLLRGVG